MILEYKLDYRSSSLVYEKIFLRTLNELSLNGNISKEYFILKLFIEAESKEKLEEFVMLFTKALPHSIFLHASSVSMVEKMPTDKYILENQKKLSIPFCPKCLSEVIDVEHKNYYNIFTECEVCGYEADGENRSYKKEFEETALKIKEGKVIELNTFYTKYYVGKPNKICNEIFFDIVAYDLATIEKYTNFEKEEITALGAIEKPLVKLKKTLKFTMDFEDVESDLIRFKIADDFILYFLMQELHKLDIDIIFITKEKIPSENNLLLIEPKEELESIEVVVSTNDIAIVRGEKGLPSFPVSAEEVNPGLGSFYSVIKEHNIDEDSIAGIYLSKIYSNNILVQSKKFGVIKYLSLNFEFDSMKDILEKISATNESGEKIIRNFRKKFPEHFSKINEIIFKEKEFNIYKLWGVIAMVIDITKDTNPLNAAHTLEENAMLFLGKKGPRIDYKLLNIKDKVSLDPLMTIRTAMSFKLAGVDNLTLCYGVIESFLEFLANEFDDIKQHMNVNAIVVTGSLLGNKHLFSKLSREISVNHNIYFNNELPVDGRNMFYGGVSLDK
ncbi:MAG: hydrogenase [Sulfurimonas sp.]|nr:MAG: hydrogenase [Sulfurimonas sp.]